MEKSDRITTESLVENKRSGASQKRALMTALENKLKQVPLGQSKSAEELIAEMVVEVALTGEVQLISSSPEKKAPIMEFSPRDWYEAVKWIYERVEGKPIQAIDASMKSSIYFDGMDTMVLEEMYDADSEVDGLNELHTETEGMSSGATE